MNCFYTHPSLHHTGRAAQAIPKYEAICGRSNKYILQRNEAGDKRIERFHA